MANLPTLRDLSKVQRHIDRVFDDFIAGLPERFEEATSGFSPAYDVRETEKYLIMSFDLPGVKEEDIRLELQGDQLRIFGERKSETDEKRGKLFRRREVSYGTFEQTFTISSGVKPEDIMTDYRDGVLKVAVPKMETAKPQPIKIGRGETELFETKKAG
jgi:HSP20 family protein